LNCLQIFENFLWLEKLGFSIGVYTQEKLFWNFLSLTSRGPIVSVLNPRVITPVKKSHF
jgi:hypothetical protein